jgi:hypothetical protein
MLLLKSVNYYSFKTECTRSASRQLQRKFSGENERQCHHIEVSGSVGSPGSLNIFEPETAQMSSSEEYTIAGG